MMKDVETFLIFVTQTVLSTKYVVSYYKKCKSENEQDKKRKITKII